MNSTGNLKHDLRLKVSFVTLLDSMLHFLSAGVQKIPSTVMSITQYHETDIVKGLF